MATRSEDIIDTRLHDANKKEDIISLLAQYPPIDVNAQLQNGDSPLHCYVKQNTDKSYNCLLAFLSNCDPNRLNMDVPGYMLRTPLHVASEVNNLDAAKALITFGADIVALDFHQQTPLDIARNLNHLEMADLLFTVGSELGHIVHRRLETFVLLPKAPSVYDHIEEESIDWKDLSLSLKEEKTSYSRSLSSDAENSLTAWIEWKKRRAIMKESRQQERLAKSKPIFTSKGEHVLCLDGGGMRGLIQIETLSHIVELTGRNIPELFEWIVGTSTGGIVALALVYGNKDICYLRKLYFELKEKVFGSARFGYGCDTEALEQILKREFGEMKMEPLNHGPNAVDKHTNKLKLCWFNNCLHDDFYGFPLWKVARYTSAAPLYFKPMDNYIDGGLRAHNPSLSALSVIENYYNTNSINQRLSLVVSVGCGKFPSKDIGDIDIEKYLFLDRKWSNPLNFTCEVKNLIQVFLHAIDNTEEATRGAESRCRAENIAFYRFNPNFDNDIRLSETNNKILCDMVVKTRTHLISKLTDIEEVVQSFYRLRT